MPLSLLYNLVNLAFDFSMGRDMRACIGSLLFSFDCLEYVMALSYEGAIKLLLLLMLDLGISLNDGMLFV